MMHSTDFYRSHYGSMAAGTNNQRYVSVQKGNGFFGRVVRGSLMPIIKSVLPFLKNVALEGVGGLVNEMKEGKSLKDATANQLKRTSDTVLTEMAKRVRRQSGSGIRKKRKRGRKVTLRRKRTGRAQGLFKV